MRSVLAFLLATLVASPAWADLAERLTLSFDAQDWVSLGGGGPYTGDVYFGDSVKLCWGNDCDYWALYNLSGTQFEIWTSDKDGGGTDGELMTCTDGTDECTFYDTLNLVNGADVSADNARITWGAAGATDSYSEYNGTNLRFYSSGSVFMLSPLEVGTWEIEQDTGTLTTENQEMSSSLADGTEVCHVRALDSNNAFAPCAEADGSGGVDVIGTNFYGLTGMVETCRSYPNTLDFGAGAASVTWTGALPVGAYRVAVTGRVIEADTGAATTLDIGDSTDGDLYANDLDETSTTETFGSADHTATILYNVDATSGASNIVASTDGTGNAVDLRVYLVVSYCTSTGPTSSP
jgi:hypothetical protein